MGGQINELIQAAKSRHADRQLFVELLAPHHLLCSPRELLTVANSSIGTRTWLETKSAFILRWHDRMKGDENFFPGDWAQRTNDIERSLTGAPGIDIGWLDEPPPGLIVGLAFPGPSPYGPDRDRNRETFFSALLKGDPWMCWPRVEHADRGAFKQAVRDFVLAQGAGRKETPHYLAEALRAERSRNGDAMLCSLWLFIDDPKRNPYDEKFTETSQREPT
jgi:hypothetical protein